MKKINWLLALISVGERAELSPLQIQKGMFLFAMESAVPSREKYEFVPYNYGACSFDIYDDLNSLEQQGLIERTATTASSYPLYRTTSAGNSAANAILVRGKDRDVETLRANREFVEIRMFQALLRDVYAKYPEYAQRSLWRHLAPNTP